MKEKIDLSALFKSDEDAKKELISLKKYAKIFLIMKVKYYLIQKCYMNI